MLSFFRTGLGAGVGGLFFAAAAFGNPQGLTVVALGDSTTAGTPGFKSAKESPPFGSGDRRSQYAFWVLQRHPEWRVLNQGVNGERSDEVLRRFESDVLAKMPDVLILLAGVNDLYQGFPVRRVEENLQSIYTKAREEGFKVMACTILPYDGASPQVQAKMRELNDWIRSNAKMRGLGLCDLFEVMEDPERPGYLIQTADGLHPDVGGYHRMGDALTDALEEWLKLPRTKPAPTLLEHYRKMRDAATGTVQRWQKTLQRQGEKDAH